MLLTFGICALLLFIIMSEEPDADLKKQCEIRWNSTLLVARHFVEGPQELKDQIISDRIAKFHLYNTHELRNYTTHRKRQAQTHRTNGGGRAPGAQEPPLLQAMEEEEQWERSLMLTEVDTKDLNYVKALFASMNVRVEKVRNYPESQAIQLHTQGCFQRVEECLQKLDVNDY